MRKSAFRDEGHWYKGNINTHTTLSDGAIAPDDQIKEYKAHGYDFLAFTDHNVMNLESRWGSDGFLMIPGWERDIVHEPEVSCTHVVGLFGSDMGYRQIKLPPGDKRVMTDHQMIDDMRARGNAFISLAHPS